MPKIAIIGQGLASASLGWVLNNAGWDVHIYGGEFGGNCSDMLNPMNGVYSQHYGPHIFHYKPHDNLPMYFHSLVSMATMIPWQYKVLSITDEGLLPYPPNRVSLANLKSEPEVNDGHVDLESVMTSILGRVGFEAYIKYYSEKQWGRPCSEIEMSPSFRSRFVLNETEHGEFFPGQLSMLPRKGYSHWIHTMMTECHIHDIGLLKIKDLMELEDSHDAMVVTASPDSIVNFRFGVLPYISTHFINDADEMQQVLGYDYHRIFKHVQPLRQDYVAYNLSLDTLTRVTRLTNYGKFSIGYNTNPKFQLEQVSNNINYGVRTHPNRHDKSGADIYDRSVAYLKDSLTVKTYMHGRLGTYSYLDMNQILESSCRLAGVIQREIIAE